MTEVTEHEGILENRTRHVKEKMQKAIRCIDEEFGEGFAQNNTILVAAFMQSIEMEEISSEIYELRESLEEKCNDISSVLNSMSSILEK